MEMFTRPHRKYERLKFGNSEAYDRPSEWLLLCREYLKEQRDPRVLSPVWPDRELLYVQLHPYSSLYHVKTLNCKYYVHIDS
jgi:hypothetical protein